MKLIAFYTKDTPYADTLQEILLPSIIKYWKYPFEIFPIQSQGSWVKNCALKPSVVLNAYHTSFDHTLMYLDVDAEILKEFEIPEFEDIAFRRYQGKCDSALFFFRRTATTQELLVEWERLCIDEPKIWDQIHMDQALENCRIRETPLEKEWCFIDRLDGKPTGDEIIYQHQISRKLKNVIK